MLSYLNYTIAIPQILGYVKLLLITQRGKREEIEAALRDCFPDINVPIDAVRILYTSLAILHAVLCYFQSGRTALLFAALQGHQVLMEPLLDHGADMYLCDRVSLQSHVMQHSLCTGHPHPYQVWSVFT